MSTGTIFHDALQLLLRPIARYCMKHAMRLQEVVEVMKQVFVEVGAETLEGDGHDVTVARISVMTGVHRRDATRLIDQSRAEPPATGSLISRIVGQWQGDATFCGRAGKPRILTFGAFDSEFSQLCYTVTRELNPSLVLSELERAGMATRTPKGIKLLDPILHIHSQAAEALTLLAEDSSDLMSCVESNIVQSEEIKHLHIKTEFDSIPDSLVSEARRHVLEEGTKFHREIAKYLGSKDKDLNSQIRNLPGRNRVAVGSFSFASNVKRNEKMKKEKEK